MAMTKEEIILKKLFVALDDRTLDLEKVGQHLAGLPTSYALESLEGAMEHRALWAEQQQQRQEEIEQREHEEHLARMASHAYSKTWRGVLSDVSWELLANLVLLIPFVLVFLLIGAIWWW